MVFDTIISGVSIITSLTACTAVYIYFRRVPKGKTFLSWLLMLCGMWLLTLSEIIDAFLPARESLLDLFHNLFTILAEIIFAASFVRLFLVDFIRVRSSITQLKEQADYDDLSGLANRRFFDEKLKQEVEDAVTNGTSIALAIFDLDHFKNVNDFFGHPAGDEAIRFVSQLICSLVRSQDLAARIGGDEIGLILLGTTTQEAKIAVERIRKKIEDTPFMWNGEYYPLTCSIGVACNSENNLVDADQLYSQADKALYQAKGEGRNRVRVQNIQINFTQKKQ